MDHQVTLTHWESDHQTMSPMYHQLTQHKRQAPGWISTLVPWTHLPRTPSTRTEWTQCYESIPSIAVVRLTMVAQQLQWLTYQATHCQASDLVPAWQEAAQYQRCRRVGVIQISTVSRELTWVILTRWARSVPQCTQCAVQLAINVLLYKLK